VTQGAAAKADAKATRQKLDDLVNVIEEHASPSGEADDLGGATLPSRSSDLTVLLAIARRIRGS